MSDAVDTLQPGGSTPLTEAVRIAADEPYSETRPAPIVHFIGFEVRSAFFSWNCESDDEIIESASRCLADQTGGTYTSAEAIDQ